MQAEAISEALHATTHVLGCLISQQTDCTHVTDDATLGQLGITDSRDSLAAFGWRLYDALFVRLDPQEISPDWSIAHLAALLDLRKPTDRSGLTPIELFLALRRGFTTKYDRPPDLVCWDSNPYDAHDAVKPARRFSFARFEWGEWGCCDLLEAVDAELGREHEFFDGILPKLNTEVFSELATVGFLVNYFWRLRTSEGRRATPRFAVEVPQATDTSAMTIAARSNLKRLLTVMIPGVPVPPEEPCPIDRLLLKIARTGKGEHLKHKRMLAIGRSLLDFEVRSTFGVEPGGWHQRIYGDVCFRLPTRVRTFGDLVTYVAKGWSSS